MSGWRRVLREPLLHFLVVGAVLFGAYHLLTPSQEEAANTNQIVLTKDDLRQLAISWLAQGRSSADTRADSRVSSTRRSRRKSCSAKP